jgi:3-oxoacyl-[acyl-carrier-protein] synthase III
VVFAPGYGAGAVGGYAVLTIDPAVIAPDPMAPTVATGTTSRRGGTAPTPSENVHAAFG